MKVYVITEANNIGQQFGIDSDLYSEVRGIFQNESDANDCYKKNVESSVEYYRKKYKNESEYQIEKDGEASIIYSDTDVTVINKEEIEVK